MSQNNTESFHIKKDPIYIYLYSFGFFSSLLAIFYITLLPFEFSKFTYQIKPDFSEIFQLRLLSVRDFVPNVLLFIPTAYFLSGLWSPRKINFNNIFFHLIEVFIYMTIVAFINEAIQIFNSERVCSLSDVFAHIIGSLIGMLIFHIQLFFSTKPNDKDYRIFTYLSLGILAEIIVILTLVVVTTEVQIKHFLLIYLANNLPQQYLVFDFIRFFPIGLIIVIILDDRDCLFGKLSCLTLWAILITIIYQVFYYGFDLYSFDISQIIVVFLAVLLGIVPHKISNYLANSYDSYPITIYKSVHKYLRPILFLYLIFLFYKFIYPNNGIENLTAINEKVKALWNLPFINYYQSNYYLALLNLITKFATFYMLGFMFALYKIYKKYKFNYIKLSFKLTMQILIIACLIEFSQIFIIGRTADLTDIVIYTLAAHFGSLTAFCLRNNSFKESFKDRS